MSGNDQGTFSVCVRGPYRFTRNLGGTIYLVCDGKSFPAEAWFDLPVIILSWWVEAAVGLRLGRTQKAEFPFMDGPFAAIVDKRDSRWHLVGVRHRESAAPDVLVECVVSERVALSALHRAATDLVETCHREHWITSDLALLEQHLPDLQP